MVNLDYKGIEFLVSKKGYREIVKRDYVSINIFRCKNKEAYPIYLSKENFENHMELLLLGKKRKFSSYLDQNVIDLCLIKQSIKIKIILHALLTMLEHQRNINKSS